MRKSEARSLLQRALQNSQVDFRAGQWEAIDALANQQRRILVVQRTGWGKSSVYFIATRILRDRGTGPTFIISPLLALMRDQIESARHLGLEAVSINSSNSREWEGIYRRVQRNEVDVILVSPERLSNEGFIRNVLSPISNRVGLLVVDEAHCISDWGHDFRPDYRLIVNMLKQLPPRMPVICTTATANERVVRDVRNQIPALEDNDILRGPLKRESLALQTICLPSTEDRLAWLARHLPFLRDEYGSGIVYTLTKRDANRVSKWLKKQRINVEPYYSDTGNREELEKALLCNNIDALVATVALGMGYNKPDLGFVIHYQAPQSVVHYYQQVGRAGRNIDQARGILFWGGSEDEKINEYFISRAFPE